MRLEDLQHYESYNTIGALCKSGTNNLNGGGITL